MEIKELQDIIQQNGVVGAGRLYLFMRQPEE